MTTARTVGVVLYDGFQQLDVFGPLDLFAVVPDAFEVVMLGPSAGPVASSQGIEVAATYAYQDAPPVDIVLVPGGHGARQLVQDRAFLDWLARYANDAPLVTSVCTGSVLLAAAGLLEGYRATSNKRAFRWAAEHGDNVDWVAKARWVVDGNRWTSSGIAAGMDMAAALIEALYGEDAANAAVDRIELERHLDAGWDPFAKLHNLV